jgi:preprotein translocase subunit SecA
MKNDMLLVSLTELSHKRLVDHGNRETRTGCLHYEEVQNLQEPLVYEKRNTVLITHKEAKPKLVSGGKKQGSERAGNARYRDHEPLVTLVVGDCLKKY